MKREIGNINCIVLGGGFGTRLQSVVPDLQKVLAPVNGKPFLNYVIKNLISNNIKNIVLATGYRSYDVYKMFNDKIYKELNLQIIKEETPLGTGGAIKNSLSLVNSDDVFICNGDSLSIYPLINLYNFHKKKCSDISILLVSVENTSRYGHVILDDSDKIIKFQEKSNLPNKGKINAGIYLFKKEVLNKLPFGKYSLEKDFFPSHCNEKMYGLVDSFPFIDIGIPEDYYKAKDFIAESGLLSI